MSVLDELIRTVSSLETEQQSLNIIQQQILHDMAMYIVYVYLIQKRNGIHENSSIITCRDNINDELSNSVISNPIPMVTIANWLKSYTIYDRI